mmetsp:Transcript_69265/g.193799  ORF Transcript_69265/g.193799 Transcript_69265/m.193799 type:complete len:166 (+) Transcript_69265:231-728(+)
MTEGCGWCLKADKQTSYLIEDEAGGVGDQSAHYPNGRNDDDGGDGVWWGDQAAGADPYNSSSAPEDEEDLIYELRDEAGDLYYFNSGTGVSDWNPPEWIDSVDPQSGAVYYENTITGETRWEVPFDFIPVVREEAYSTPEAQFVKSVLSPKRSRGPRNFYHPHES